MSDNLPANLAELDTKELAKLTGQTEDRTGNMLPTLRVNYDDEDDDNNSLPRGQWSCYTSSGKRIFAKEVSLRIFLTKYQYNHYDQDASEMVSTSVYFSKFGDQAPDTAGGYKCNKVTKKQLKELSEAEQAVQKQIKCSRVCFGLLTAEGVDQLGEKVSVTDEPVIFYARGTHYMPMSDYIKKTSNAEGWLGGVVTNLSLKKEKNGSVTYWIVVPSMVKTIKPSEEDLAMLRQFYDTVEAENKSIVEQFYSAQKTASVQSPIPEDVPFDDGIPANMVNTLAAG